MVPRRKTGVKGDTPGAKDDKSGDARDSGKNISRSHSLDESREDPNE